MQEPGSIGRCGLAGRQAYAEAVDSLRTAAHRSADDGGRATVDRAVGLLAGRAQCRLAEAHRHLLRMAAEQQCGVADVAAGLIRLLDLPEGSANRAPPAALLDALPLRPAVRGPDPVHRF